jgi:hypothetical protein
MNDEQLTKLSYELDDTLTKLCIEYQISPLLLSSVTVARLMLMADHSEAGEDFRKLLDSCSNQPLRKEIQQVKVH